MIGARELVGALLLSAVAAAACGSSSPPSGTTEIAAKNYARNCVSVSDCFAVHEGPISCCGGRGGCPNAAIRVDAVAKYGSDVNAATPVCNLPLACDASAGLGCDDGRVACVTGVCAFEASDASTAD